jgi:hypothetical protein
MPTDVMLEKVKDAVESLYRLIRQRIPTEGQAGEVESYILLASVLADRIRAEWEQLLMQLSDGMNAEVVRTVGAVLSITVDIWSELAQDLQSMATQVAQETGRPLKGASELVDEAVRTGEIGDAARRLVDSVNAAHNLPLDQDLLRRSEDDFAAGRVQKGKDVIARLRPRKSP